MNRCLEAIPADGFFTTKAENRRRLLGGPEYVLAAIESIGNGPPLGCTHFVLQVLV
jgi:hypothetical protein